MPIDRDSLSLLDLGFTVFQQEEKWSVSTRVCAVFFYYAKTPCSFNQDTLSEWYTVQHLLSNKCCNCCSTNVEQCILWCWMLKYAVQHVESCWTKIEHGSEAIPFNKLPLQCWTASTNRFRVWCHMVSLKHSSTGVLITPINWSIWTRLFRACSM